MSRLAIDRWQLPQGQRSYPGCGRGGLGPSTCGPSERCSHPAAALCAAQRCRDEHDLLLSLAAFRLFGMALSMSFHICIAPVRSTSHITYYGHYSFLVASA